MKLLAGPILRRATPNRVCVWFATTEQVDLTLQVMSKKASKFVQLGQSAELTKNDYCQLGEHLFVYLLQARCTSTQPYPLDTFLYYQLVDTNTSKPLDLSELTYDKSTPHPKFFIPTDLKQLLHGSCCKPHGGGKSSDALSYGDSLLEKLEETDAKLNERPALLLLTGDQIYADDVSIALLAMLKEKAAMLIGTGRPELLPLKMDTLGQISYQDPQNIPLHGRKKFLHDNESGFSSGESENHLLSFGEFAAMYIYVFGNAENWQPANNWAQLASQFSTATTEIVKKAEQAFIEQQASVSNFQATLPNVRRLLANIPTYMILDDHDVTDDWNITNAWYDNVRGSLLGRRIVANALASYWAFQAWGNDPDNFDKDLQLTFSQYLLDSTNNTEINERYDLHTWKYRGWGFSVPTNPPIIAIDSRTQRAPTTDSYLPLLLDRYALDWLRLEWTKLKTGQSISADTCPIFIATTPVLGFSVLELAQKVAYWLAEWLEGYRYVKCLEQFIGKKGYLTEKIIALVDMEAWTSNQQSFLSLTNCLSEDMHIKQCVFLSGDVHYAFSAIGKYIDNQGISQLHCYQLVSTSLKNSPDNKQGKAIATASEFDSNRSTKHTSKLKALFPWLPITSWESWVHLLPSNSLKTPIYAGCNLGLVTFVNGKPVQHTLLAQDQVIYPLPDPKTFTFK